MFIPCTIKDMKELRIRSISYTPGYSDMRGALHEAALKKNMDGKWIYVCRDREDFSSAMVSTVYGVCDDEMEQFADFILEKKILSLGDRPDDRDLLATDYRPWSWNIDYETSAAELEKGRCRIEEYKAYSDSDCKLLRELKERFTALPKEKISEQFCCRDS